MKNLLKILLPGFAAFMVVAIVQEWDFFYTSWFGGASPVPLELSEFDRQGAEQAVGMTLAVMRHFYASGGDARYAERLPASDGIIEEMRADIDYLSRNRRRQDPEIKRLEFLTVTPLAEDRVELRTRELWQVRFLWAATGAEAEPPRVQVLHSRYLAVRGPQGWQVEGWAFDEPPAAEPEEVESG